jgi:hypothetical protein
MYDKYSVATSFTVGNSQLPKHKGILFSGATAGFASTATIHFIDSSGNTISGSVLINSSPYVFPMQVYAVPTLPTGITAWYLN